MDAPEQAISSRQSRTLAHMRQVAAATPANMTRVVVGNRAFRVFPQENLDESGKRITRSSNELARFKFCDMLFVVVEEAGIACEDISRDDIAERLTDRELQIAILIAQGHQVKRVAHKLGITEWTVKEYLRRIFGKLDVHNQAAMVYRCSGLLQRLSREDSEQVQKP